MKILVIEDDKQTQKIICKMLSSTGHTIITANDGERGIMKMEDNLDVSIVISDLIMPKKEGIETISEIKEAWPHVNIIAISGGRRLDPQVPLEWAELAGADITLKKPFKAQELLAAIESISVNSINNEN
jgi:DNA-binding response OmpR family regulator